MTANTNDLRGPEQAVARLTDVRLRYGSTVALESTNLVLPAGHTIAFIGPDGVGKSSLLSLIAGARRIQEGRVEVLGGDMADPAHRRDVCPRIAFMPQGLGKNLYPTLSVHENLEFFGRLFGHNRDERERRIADLTASTALSPFLDRPAGKLSGGMKQKLSLCCALIHDPDLLILDEPTTGVDPLARRQFWELIARIRDDHPGMSVLVATAYMDEAAQFEKLVAMDEGRILGTGTTTELLERTGTKSLEAAFIELLPEDKRRGHHELQIPPRSTDESVPVVIQARDLTKKFGSFTAVNQVSFRIESGEIFGFLGSNGCGKSTTMKMLTGLLPATSGEAWLLGEKIDAQDLSTRRRIGYMSQAFSLYSELTVRQNLVLHARLFAVPEREISERVALAIERFGLAREADALPESMSLGQRQRLSLAVALIHQPEVLILDEPTSGVDPVARDSFWEILVELSRRDRVTIFVSTHFVNEAERCDRISLMHAGRVLVCDAPDEVVRLRQAESLEDAFIGYLEDATAADERLRAANASTLAQASRPTADDHRGARTQSRFTIHLRRLLSYSGREALELARDPIRATLALFGSVILMFIMGYGITLDIEDLTFAFLDRDQTTTSRDYALNVAGSRYFTERPPLTDYNDLDRRMRSGEISVAFEIPPRFALDIARGTPTEVATWIDGSMPSRGETIRTYVQGLHNQWLQAKALERIGRRHMVLPATIATRYRYNPDVKSLVAMAPAVIPLLLLLFPAMLTALSIVREKELGSIVNLYVTPVTRLEFLLGKQIPYIALGMLNYIVLMTLAVTAFGVPFTGSLMAMTLAAFLYIAVATAMGLLVSTFIKSQVAALFATSIFTMLPASQFSGIINPVSSLEGTSALIGRIYPTSHFLLISRGTFSKGLELADLGTPLLALAITLPILLILSVILLKKQED